MYVTKQISLFLVMCHLIMEKGCFSLVTKPSVTAKTIEAINECKSDDVLVRSGRRKFLESMKQQLVLLTGMTGTTSIIMTSSSLYPQPAFAKNLPDSTGADLSKVGTIDTLVPILSLRQSIQAIQTSISSGKTKGSGDNIRQLIQQQQNVIPCTEKEFKRIFDEYSDPVSYKQKYLDSNAFLVYYTKGFDGPGRDSIENYNDNEQRQTQQFGTRNEAWIAWENALTEIKFIDNGDDDDDIDDLKKYIRDTLQAIDSYILLAPKSDVEEAQSRLVRGNKN